VPEATYAVTGGTASSVDSNTLLKQSWPRVFAFVLTFAFLLLLVSFRSLVIAAKAIALNLLSVGAAYGVLVAAFQYGWAERILGFRSNGDVWYAVIRARILMRSDGSFRIRRVDKGWQRSELLGFPAWGPAPLDPDLIDSAYDAASGVARDFYNSSDTGIRMDVTRDCPLGPPDRWANFQADLSAVALALQHGGPATLHTTSYEDRPAWVISMTGLFLLMPLGGTYAVTIDEETCLPVRVQARREGALQLDYSWHNLRTQARGPHPSRARPLQRAERARSARSRDRGRRER
jgi:hypothetical protein